MFVLYNICCMFYLFFYLKHTKGHSSILLSIAIYNIASIYVAWFAWARLVKAYLVYVCRWVGLQLHYLYSDGKYDVSTILIGNTKVYSSYTCTQSWARHCNAVLVYAILQGILGYENLHCSVRSIMFLFWWSLTGVPYSFFA